MMSTNSNVALIPDSPSGRRVRSSSSSVSSAGSKPGKSSVRKSSSLPSETVDYLKAWMMSPEHVAHPYPTEQEKAQIMAATGIELKQLTNWFVNNRKRYWKPRVEARLQQQAQVQAAAAAAAVAAAAVAQVVPTKHSRSSTSSPYIALDMTQPPTMNVVSSGEEQNDPYLGQNARKVSVVCSDNISSFVPHSQPHTVSEASSSGSETDSLSSSNESEEDMHGLNTSEGPTERVDAYVLRPLGAQENLKLRTSQLSPKRKRASTDEAVTSPRRSKYLRKSPLLWREACHKADYCFDDGLPSLEEAAHLFGFLQSS